MIVTIISSFWGLGADSTAFGGWGEGRIHLYDLRLLNGIVTASDRIVTMKRYFTDAQLDRAIAKQNHECAYCALPFGTITSRRGRVEIQVVQGDHVIPWAYGGGTLESNLVAACNICNMFKSSLVFADRESAWRHIARKRVLNRVVIEYVPLVAMTDDPNKWASEYARYLSG